MSYDPTTWSAGDVITAAKMNKIEQGISQGGGGLIVDAEIEDDMEVLSETYGTIADCIKGGGVVYVHIPENVSFGGDPVTMNYYSPVEALGDSENGPYMIKVTLSEGPTIFYAISRDEYPTTEPPSDDDDEGGSNSGGGSRGK